MNARLAQGLLSAIQNARGVDPAGVQPHALGPGVLPPGTAQAMNDPEMWLERHRYARTHGHIPSWVSQDIAHARLPGPAPSVPAGALNSSPPHQPPGMPGALDEIGAGSIPSDVGRFAPRPMPGAVQPPQGFPGGISGLVHRLPPVHPQLAAARAALGYS